VKDGDQKVERPRPEADVRAQVKELQARLDEIEPAAKAAQRIRAGMVGCQQVFEKLQLTPVEASQVLGYMQWQAAVQAAMENQQAAATTATPNAGGKEKETPWKRLKQACSAILSRR